MTLAAVQSRNATNQRDRLVEIIAEITGSGELALEELLTHGPKAAEPRRPEILPIRQGRETVIEDGKYKDGEVSFSVTRERNGQKSTTKYHAKVSGDTWQ